jgi:hypothetical protein
MTFILILFFASLIAITFMVGRKLLMLQNGEIQQGQEIAFKAPALEEWKHITIRGAKRHSYNILVITIRFYFRTTNLLKLKYQDVKIKVKNIRRKSHVQAEKQEISKFLKVISEYKSKIRKIKQQVKEEENL